ncbi:hypothetical protein P3S67_019429 [Capsicum chacoense]
MKKSTSSSTGKSRGKQAEQQKLTEMKAALQLIHFSGSNDSNIQDNDAESGSKLLVRDEEGHHVQQGIISKKKKIKFRSIIDLYKCTDRLSPVEDEYNWSSPAGKIPNTDISQRTNKKNAKILKYYPEVNSDGEMMDKNGCVNKRKFRPIADIYESTKPVGRNKNKH